MFADHINYYSIHHSIPLQPVKFCVFGIIVQSRLFGKWKIFPIFTFVSVMYFYWKILRKVCFAIVLARQKFHTAQHPQFTVSDTQVLCCMLTACPRCRVWRRRRRPWVQCRAGVPVRRRHQPVRRYRDPAVLWETARLESHSSSDTIEGDWPDPCKGVRGARR